MVELIYPELSYQIAPRDIMQVLAYLKQSGLELGILASLNRNTILFKRILKGRK
ncbi:MAG: hypothetical protein NT099_00720 [Candidatus Saganbacteria bacterium]|nr:hypothetical protein [Candidatus Saganbacteria bacterium]